MKILSWNCQGLENPWTVRNLRKFMKDQAPSICFLMETKLDREGLNQWCKELLYKNRFVVKKPSLGGKLALMWKEDMNLDVFKYLENQVSAMVTESDGFQWVLTGFYGWPETHDQYKSWALLTHISSLVHRAWMCIGDFNEMLSSLENSVADQLLRGNWMLFMKRWNIGIWLILGSSAIRILGTTDDQGMPTPRNGWTEQSQMRFGGQNFLEQLSRILSPIHRTIYL